MRLKPGDIVANVWDHLYEEDDVERRLIIEFVYGRKKSVWSWITDNGKVVYEHHIDNMVLERYWELM